MNFEKIELLIGAHFVCALEYGDESGLTDEESAQLENFIATLPRSGHWSFGESEEFARCEVSGLHGECVHADYLYIDSRA